jgi:hypothetical protein
MPPPRGGGGPRPRGGFGAPMDMNLNTSINGYYTNTLREQMPPTFSQQFRARPSLDYIPPSD